MISKQQLRQDAKLRRAAMSSQQVESLSLDICTRLMEVDPFVPCRCLFIYVSFGKEVSTHALIRSLLHQDLTVAVPRMTDDQRMVPVQIHAWDDLVPSQYGILAPDGGQAYAGPLDVCVTPGLAFSANGHRLGYGRGHYDQFLNAHRDLLAIGLAFEQQLHPEIPTESHDETLDLIVTEQRTLLTGRRDRQSNSR